MNDKELSKKKPWHKKSSTWITIGVVILVVLLFLWVDIADIMGAGDGGTGVNEMPIELDSSAQ